MHILLIHQAFASIEEPGGTRHHEIARQLRKMNYKITVITGQVSYLTGRAVRKGIKVIRELDDCGVEILRVPSYQQWHRSFLHRFISFMSFMIISFIVGLRTRNVDVVWGTTPPLFQGLTAWIVARMKGAKFLFEVRDLWPKFAIALGVLRNRFLIWLSNGLEGLLYRHADSVVINSPGYKEHVLARGAKDVVLIPNGVNVDLFSEGIHSNVFQDDVRLAGKFIVLYAGAHGEANDLTVVLEAASRLKGRGEIQFIFIGDGKEKLDLVKKANEQALENVIFLPPVSKREIAGVIASADVCLAILKPLEAFRLTYPNKVFDYLAAGKPVILAIDGEIRKVVEEARAGIFVQPGDAAALAYAVTELWQNPEQVKRMGVAGREYVLAKFNRSMQVEALDKLLMRISDRG